MESNDKHSLITKKACYVIYSILSLLLTAVTILAIFTADTFNEMRNVEGIVLASFFLSLSAVYYCRLSSSSPVTKKFYVVLALCGTMLFATLSTAGVVLNTCYAIISAKNATLINKIDVTDVKVKNTKFGQIYFIDTPQGAAKLRPNKEFEKLWTNKSQLFHIQLRSKLSDRIVVDVVCHKLNKITYKECAKIIP